MASVRWIACALMSIVLADHAESRDASGFRSDADPSQHVSRGELRPTTGNRGPITPYLFDAAVATMPIADWETTPASVRSKSDPAWTPYLNPFFTSRKTLDETTSWLRLMIGRFGDVPPRQRGDDAYWTGDVRFNGCTMSWVARQTTGTNIEERAYTLNLKDIDGKYGSIQVDDRIIATTRDGTEARWISRYYTNEGGRRTARGEPRPQSDTTFYIDLQPANDLPRRVAQALVHASRLCGGLPPH
jgi:hypothetical protein